MRNKKEGTAKRKEKERKTVKRNEEERRREREWEGEGEDGRKEQRVLVESETCTPSTKHFGRSKQRYNLPVCLALFILLAC